MIRLADYAPHPRNYNQHPPEQIEKLAASLRAFGQVRSVVVWRRWFLAGTGLALVEANASTEFYLDLFCLERARQGAGR